MDFSLPKLSNLRNSETSRIDSTDNDFVPILENQNSSPIQSFQSFPEEKPAVPFDEILREFRHFYTQRPWSRGPQGQYKIMSYNVLSDHCIKKSQRGLYSCKPEDLDIEKRSKLIIDEIKYHDPDLLALQEVDEGYEAYTSLEGYEKWYKKRLRTDLDGCMILWKSSLFTLVERFDVEYYSEDPEFQNYLSKANIGIITILRLNSEDSKYILFANTHFLFSPHKGDRQFCQIYTMLKSIEAILVKYTGFDVSILFAGDFNLTPCGGIYHFLENKILNLLWVKKEDLNSRYIGLEKKATYKRILEVFRTPFSYKDHQYMNNCEIAHILNSIRVQLIGNTFTPVFCNTDIDEDGTIAHNLDIKSCYKSCVRYEPFPTTFLDDSRSTVDYIWYGGSVAPSRVLMSPRFEFLDGFSGAPNEILPSDHFPIIAEFNFINH
ncbi:unnamed protein product [Blepharisma stoltei]|uniref:Endonuclease/exonuclease/phosphatase domain-containing protein n=1 Tax=Blepharisma stoltei TaxID=1481888 RepID=A0AAU9K4Y9_9CILI|nr:unnamed protein product [Blepharisma stoltei]